MSEPITPAIERFLLEFAASKGYGLKWECIAQGELRSPGDCCPLTAEAQELDIHWEDCYPVWMKRSEAERITQAADNNETEPEIRRRLLAAVGLSEPTA